MLAKKLGLHKYGMDKNRCFGDGTLRAVNYLLGRWGYLQNRLEDEHKGKKSQDVKINIIGFKNKKYLVGQTTGELLEILSDKSPSGKERPWRKHKIVASSSLIP